MFPRHVQAVIAVVALATLGVVAIILVVAVASVSPSTRTTDRYATLIQHQRTRQDVRPAPTVASIVRPTPIRDPTLAPSPTPITEETTFGAPADRIRITAIDAVADIVDLGILPTGQMESPDSPTVVGWYRFTGKPGSGGNAVMSGHVDYRGHGPAVFWDLKNLEPGDTVEITLTDGTLLIYRVTSSLDAPVDDLQMEAILAPTESESLTLITCSGTLSNGTYSNRLVVRAVRMSATPAESHRR